ncbi:MAG: heparan-alpha-glucosaminide N-acetyltransferase, partial [Methanotrichaceae archaeon]
MMHKGRFWEIDLIRGLAVVMMVLFHLAYDLSFFGIYALDIYSGFWFYFARITASIFILLVGVSLVLFASRSVNNGQGELRIKLLKRGTKIFSLGLGITAITYILIGKGFIIFGVLHFIGLSIILAYPFLNFKKLNMVMGVIIIAVGLYLQNFAFGFPWLLWLGLSPMGFYTVDYFPLLPWFGLVLIGIYLGNALYCGNKRKVELPDLSSNAFVRPIIL